ncbi:hypothetical protein MMC19_002668 [Ptychographa xylographoides]|nr:hypothetical protein [Ptychographa xylographoides]
MPLPAEVQASYVVIIDSILASSDLNTITSKRIREGLQRAVDYDITPQKDEIKALIMTRFDRFVAEQNAVPRTNGHSVPSNEGTAKVKKDSFPPTKKVVQKRKSESGEDEDDSELSNVPITPPPKKKRKAISPEDDDAVYAAKLQAELNSLARPTRGGASKKSFVIKKKKTPRKKTSSKIKAEDDSDLEGSGNEEKKVNRSGGFHKPLILSAPLSALLDGETQLSRPQTVKRIWAYVRERDLQDPNDKRQIRCDEAMKAVFKQDTVHMFTMNKILGKNLYNPEE